MYSLDKFTEWPLFMTYKIVPRIEYHPIQTILFVNDKIVKYTKIINKQVRQLLKNYHVCSRKRMMNAKWLSAAIYLLEAFYSVRDGLLQVNICKMITLSRIFAYKKIRIIITGIDRLIRKENTLKKPMLATGILKSS